MSRDRLRPWWRIVGPWSLQPVAAAFLTWAFAATISAGRLSTTQAGLTLGQLAEGIARAFLPALSVFVTLWLLRRFVPQASSRLSIYLLSVVAAAVAFSLVRLAFGDIFPAGDYPLGGALLVTVFRNAIIIVIIQAVIGLPSWRLRLENRRTQEALALAREHQRQLLDADERVRGQVSAFLHDRVQGGLIAACLELADVAHSADSATRASIDGIVQRLEDLRALDVRSAARALSPDLANTDFRSALEDLSRQYAPSMLITVEIDPRLASRITPLEDTSLLGCFRIVEQAVLNAVVHGRARNCQVRVDLVADGLAIAVTDDGVGIKAGGTPGLGSALTTTWTTLFGGSWSRETLPAGGTRLNAFLGSYSQV